jgi:hypothetical protein
VKRILLWIIVAAALVTGFVLYRARSGSRLNVTPDAEREIEKAMRPQNAPSRPGTSLRFRVGTQSRTLRIDDPSN